MDFQIFKEKYQKIRPEEFTNSTPEPLLSICVQTYQHAGFIKDCLEGILKQETSFPYEVLLGEDDSTDGTREICLEYAKKYPDKIRLFLHHRVNNIKINGQPTGRFNFLYNMYSARGKYIAFCEGDDYWTDPLKLQKQVSHLEENKDFVLNFHNARIGNGQELKFKYLDGKSDFSSKELKTLDFPISTLTLCFRNIIKEFPPEFLKVVNGDTFLCFLLGSFGKAKYLKNISPAVYRIHEGGIWSLMNFNEQKLSRAITFQYISAFLIRNEEFQYLKRFNELTLGELGSIKNNINKTQTWPLKILKRITR